MQVRIENVVGHRTIGHIVGLSGNAFIDCISDIRNDHHSELPLHIPGDVNCLDSGHVTRERQIGGNTEITNIPVKPGRIGIVKIDSVVPCDIL